MRYGLPRAAGGAFFAPCAISSPGRTAAAPSAASLPKNPRRGGQQAQERPAKPLIFSALFFSEATVMETSSFDIDATGFLDAARVIAKRARYPIMLKV